MVHPQFKNRIIAPATAAVKGRCHRLSENCQPMSFRVPIMSDTCPKQGITSVLTMESICNDADFLFIYEDNTMKQYKTYSLKKALIGLAFLLMSLHIQAQVQLVDLQSLDSSYADYQSGKIPVFSSLMHHKGPYDLDLVLPEDTNYDPDDADIFMAVIDNRLVLLPKKYLQISNGLPFVDIMSISNGFLQLSKKNGMARWRYNAISNGYLKFKGYAPIDSFIAIAGTGINSLPNNSGEEMPVTALASTQDDDDDAYYDFLLHNFLRELSRNFNPWDYICVYVDGVKVEMSAGAVSAHLRNGAFHLAGGNRFNPEYP